MIISSSHERTSVPYELLALGRRLQVTMPECEKIDAYFYGDRHLSTAQIHQLVKEIEEIRKRYLVEAKVRLARLKSVHAKDPAVREAMLEGMIKDHLWRTKLDEILLVCRDALAMEMLVCSGD